MELIFDNPIVRREIRARMRGNRALLVQLAYLGVLTAVIVGVYLYNDQHPSSGTDRFELGRTLFTSLTIAQGLLIALIAPALSAGAVCGEREQQTLDGLFCTPLGTGSIFRGKLVACTLFLGLLLTLGLPLMAVCLMMGGVGPQELVGTYAVHIANALLLASVGLGWSLVCNNTTLATTATYLTVIGYLFLTGCMVDGGEYKALSAACPPAAFYSAAETLELWGAQIPVWVTSSLAVLLVAVWVLDVSAARARLLRDGRVSVRPRLWLVAACLGTLAYGLTLGAPDFAPFVIGAIVVLCLAPVLVCSEPSEEERQPTAWSAFMHHSPRSAPLFMTLLPLLLVIPALTSFKGGPLAWQEGVDMALLVALLALATSQFALLVSRTIGRRWPSLWLTLAALASLHGYLAAAAEPYGLHGFIGTALSPFAVLVESSNTRWPHVYTSVWAYTAIVLLQAVLLRYQSSRLPRRRGRAAAR